MSEGNPLRHIENIVLLRNTPIFSGLAPSQLQRIAMSLREHRYEKGQKIVEKGTILTTLTIVKNGSCSLGQDIVHHGNVIKPAAIFIPMYRLRENVIALEETTIVTLDQGDLYETLQSNPSTALRLIEWFAQKIEEDKTESE